MRRPATVGEQASHAGPLLGLPSTIQHCAYKPMRVRYITCKTVHFEVLKCEKYEHRAEHSYQLKLRCPSIFRQSRLLFRHSGCSLRHLSGRLPTPHYPRFKVDGEEQRAMGPLERQAPPLITSASRHRCSGRFAARSFELPAIINHCSHCFGLPKSFNVRDQKHSTKKQDVQITIPRCRPTPDFIQHSVFSNPRLVWFVFYS